MFQNAWMSRQTYNKTKTAINLPPSTTRTLQSLCRTTMPVINNWFAFISTLNFFAGFDRFRILFIHITTDTAKVLPTTGQNTDQNRKLDQSHRQTTPVPIFKMDMQFANSMAHFIE